MIGKRLDAFDPQIDYVMKLFGRHREKSSTRLREGAALPPAILAAFPHPGCRRFMRPPLRGEHVDNAEIEHFLAGIDRAAGNNPLRQGLPCPTREQGNRAHSRKSVEADFRQTKFGVAFDDKEVGHESAFETSAQALTVHGRKRHDRQVKSHVQTMHDVDANIGVGAQHLVLAVSDRHGEGREIPPRLKTPGRFDPIAK